MKPSIQALGRLKTGVMNKTEALYASDLELQRSINAIAWYRFEGLKFRLADNTFYTPDFAVMLNTGQIELREVKGHWADDARAKIKIAAEMYPFQFVAIKRVRGQWEEERF